MFLYVFAIHGFDFSFFKHMFSMIHGPRPDLSGRTPAGERRWKLGTAAKFSFLRRFLVCDNMCPDGSCEKKQHMDIMDTQYTGISWNIQEIYGNLWKSMEIYRKSSHQFLTLDCKAGNVMIAKTHPDFPSDICLLLSTLNAKLTLMNAKRKTEMLGQKWVCLKIGNTPKPNGFADHYPY